MICAWPVACCGRGSKRPSPHPTGSAAPALCALPRSRCSRARTCRSWSALVKAGGAEDLHLSARARAVADFLAAQGASFFDDIVHGLDLPRTFVEEALGELVAAGLVNSDGFSGLRALLLPSSQRKPFAGSGRRRRTALLGVEDAGRWTIDPPPAQRHRGAAAQPAARDRRADRARSAQALRRRVLAPARAGSASGCRPGAICSWPAGAWRRAVRSAAGASWRASPGSSSRCPRRSACCAACAVKTRPARSSA